MAWVAYDGADAEAHLNRRPELKWRIWRYAADLEGLVLVAHRGDDLAHNWWLLLGGVTAFEVPTTLGRVGFSVRTCTDDGTLVVGLSTSGGRHSARCHMLRLIQPADEGS